MKTLIVLALSTFSIFVETTKVFPYPSKDIKFSDDSMDGRIVNGYLNKPGEIPYIVSLQTSPAKHICGGSIIDHEFILTAAQCLINHSHLFISYGSIKWKKPLIQHKVKEDNFFIHEKFSRAEDGSLRNDIALIRVPYVKFNDSINKISLPDYGTYETYANKWARASGWGFVRSSSHYGYASNLLQSIDVTVVGNDNCTRQFPNFNLMDSHICAGIFESKSTCYRDFGGPLVLNANESPYKKPILIGVTSFLDDRHCTPGHPNLFTRVSKFLPWITRTLEEESTLEV